MLKSGIPDSMYVDWFNLGKPIKKIEIETYSSKEAKRRFNEETDAASVASSGRGSRLSLRRGQDYVNRYKEEDISQALKGEFRSVHSREPLSDDDDTDCEDDDDSWIGARSRRAREKHFSDIGGLTLNSDYPPISDVLQEETTKIYQTFDFKRKFNDDFTINSFKEKILNELDAHPVVVIQGATGSGKTTQVPQFILDKYASMNRYCNIVVTQPRRIAAMSIAKRVCKERNWPLGRLVGYQVGLENFTSTETRLAYVTTGVLLQKLVQSKHMNDYTHVILDEVHERDMEMDFLMLLVRKLSRLVSRGTKIVLMSATIDAELFADYFSTPVRGVMQKAIEINVPDKPHQIYEYYLDQISSLGPMPVLDSCDPSISPEAINICKVLIEQFDRMEKGEQKITDTSCEFAPNRRTVLIFLPGIHEINRVYAALNASVVSKKWHLIPLHSTVTWEEQCKVFDESQPGFRKIILSTNIAESSITIPGIGFVIDFCLTKNLICDVSTNYTWLQLEWASHANCNQRRGRAGRVAHGRVYRLLTKKFYDDVLPEYGTPEMQRCPLDKVILKTKMLDMDEPKAILALALDPPNLQDIESTILTLMEIGALAAKRDDLGIKCSEDGDLTYTGRVLGVLPIDIHLGRLIVLGHAFGCLEECIIIAAGLSQKSIFAQPYIDQLEAYKHKLSWADGSFSDCIAILNIYTIWLKHKNSNYFSRPGAIPEKQWGNRFFVQVKRLNEVNKLVEELKERLDNLSISVTTHRPIHLKVAERNLLLKMVLAGAFYPNYFKQTELDEADITRAVSGYDPNNTVVIGGLPLGDSILYSEDIKSGLRNCGEIEKIHFERCSSYYSQVRQIKTQKELNPSVHDLDWVVRVM